MFLAEVTAGHSQKILMLYTWQRCWWCNSTVSTFTRVPPLLLLCLCCLVQPSTLARYLSGNVPRQAWLNRRIVGSHPKTSSYIEWQWPESDNVPKRPGRKIWGLSWCKPDLGSIWKACAAKSLAAGQPLGNTAERGGVSFSIGDRNPKFRSISISVPSSQIGSSLNVFSYSISTSYSSSRRGAGMSSSLWLSFAVAWSSIPHTPSNECSVDLHSHCYHIIFTDKLLRQQPQPSHFTDVVSIGDIR